MINSSTRYYILNEFEDERIRSCVWNELLSNSGDVIFMTWHWQKAWWETFGRGQLLLIIAEKNDKPIAIAPLFADQGMIYLVGSGGSDYLDLIGEVSNLEVLESMLKLAVTKVSGFLGFCFYHIPESSQTSEKLDVIAKQNGWEYCNEGEMNSPMLSINEFPEQAYQSTRKKSLLRHEAYFVKNGGISTIHHQKCEAVLPLLDIFFEQHIERWKNTAFPSLFLQPQQCLFYTRLVELLSETGWLRFTQVIWQNRTIAFHFGFNYKGNFLWYKPAFDITLAKHSPGEVLLRQLLLQAINEEAHMFDFGLGDELFKTRFASNTRIVYNRGLYPESSINKK
jgi:CelD/BcsL family acetyltransferase involved in cellulose biosynthesis